MKTFLTSPRQFYTWLLTQGDSGSLDLQVKWERVVLHFRTNTLRHVDTMTLCKMSQ